MCSGPCHILPSLKYFAISRACKASVYTLDVGGVFSNGEFACCIVQNYRPCFWRLSSLMLEMKKKNLHNLCILEFHTTIVVEKQCSSSDHLVWDVLQRCTCTNPSAAPSDVPLQGKTRQRCSLHQSANPPIRPLPTSCQLAGMQAEISLTLADRST